LRRNMEAIIDDMVNLHRAWRLLEERLTCLDSRGLTKGEAVRILRTISLGNFPTCDVVRARAFRKYRIETMFLAAEMMDIVLESELEDPLEIVAKFIVDMGDVRWYNGSAACMDFCEEMIPAAEELLTYLILYGKPYHELYPRKKG
jgi:hypothetical protein